MARFLVPVALLAHWVRITVAHGALTYPPSTRHGGTLAHAGDCAAYECMWFSQPMQIPGEPTVNEPKYRTYNVDVNGGEDDWSRTMPWRAPGTAPVRGSGCGVAGGSDVALFNGGFAPPGFKQGMDAVNLPMQKPQTWARGSKVEVGFALTANHGGGYTYRLCPTDGEVTEECFQQTVLKFSGETQWLQYGDAVPGAPRYELPLVKVPIPNGTSTIEWARNPIPACNMCDQKECGAATMQPCWDCDSGKTEWGGKNVTYYGGKAWIEATHCGAVCGGETLDTSFTNATGDNGAGRTSGLLCPRGRTQFAEPLPGISGFVQNHTYPGRSVSAFSIIDSVLVPQHLWPGKYLLSWRWDCEQSMQIWQSCADIEIV